ncbi:cytochrome [Rhodococcus sp. ACS1]|uniref:cytochrome P450 n=1 Tax=Rhodococcus sp. ACS1 TaxID=2028570 RepID=UPI000BB156CA|nr:cytochrome P450 [Rhodococcus sp. ACS1]PBC51870.1 cytochrome [Rhodococcus sp. ACS1]
MQYIDNEAETNTQVDTDFDHLDTTPTREEVLNEYASMREKCPVVHSPRYGGFVHVTRYDDVRAATTSPESFSSADGIFIPPSGLPRIPPLEFEGDEHHAWRSIMQAPMTPAQVRVMQPAIQDIVTKQIDRFASEGHAELVSALAEPVPVYTIGLLVGLSDASAARMRPIAKSLFDSIGTDSFDDHMRVFAEFTGAELESRRKEPREDFLSQLATGTLGDMELDDAAIAGVLVALLVGGHHSTASALSGLFHHIMTVPGIRDKVSDPRSLAKVIEESLRLTTPLQLFARTALQDVSIGGTSVAAGTRLFVNFASSNLDPRQFDDPEKFDMDRRPNNHFAFGFGEHLCIGRHLARAELQIAATELFRRLPDIAVSGDVQFTGLEGGTLMEISSLPVTFTPEKSA